MARTSNVFARVEPEIKEQAEQVLDQLGIPMSNAVSMFLRQIVLQRGIPFEVKLPERKPVAFGSLTKEQQDAELEKVQKIASDVGIAFQIQDDILDVTSTTEELGKGMADIRAGRTHSAQSVMDELKRDYGV